MRVIADAGELDHLLISDMSGMGAIRTGLVLHDLLAEGVVTFRVARIGGTRRRLYRLVSEEVEQQEREQEEGEAAEAG